MIRQYSFLGMITAFALVAAWAVAQTTDAELDQNRARVIALQKSQPEQFARLRENLKSFLALSDTQRASIVKLDAEVQKLSPKKRERLLNALERYSDWLDQLREKEPQAYRMIKEAPNDSARIALIKDRRDREWMELQPKVQRDEWNKLQGPARAEFVLMLREQERRKQEQWLIAKRFWRELESKQTMPCRLSEFTPKVREYVTDYLLPYMTDVEKKELQSAEGHWPDYPQTLVAFAVKRPPALLPEAVAPRKVSQLPKPVQTRLLEKKKGGPKKLDLKSLEGPSFASNLVKHHAVVVSLEHEYLAASYSSLLKPMKEFMDNKLQPALDQTEKRKLTDEAGKWPEYPEAIRELAKKHGLSPPWHILPEPERWRWDAYRNVKAGSWGADFVKEKKTP